MSSLIFQPGQTLNWVTERKLYRGRVSLSAVRHHGTHGDQMIDLTAFRLSSAHTSLENTIITFSFADKHCSHAVLPRREPRLSQQYSPNCPWQLSRKQVQDYKLMTSWKHKTFKRCPTLLSPNYGCGNSNPISC